MDQNALVAEVQRRLAPIVPSRSQVVLFGSRARGEERPESDLDLLVIEPAVDDAITESVRLRRALRELGVPVDVVVVGSDEARRRATVRGSLLERALREGQVLVDA